MRNKNLLPLGVAAFILLASCNGNKEKETSGNAGPEKTETKVTETKSGDVRSDINVTISGGDMNGSYTAVCKDGCCSWGIAGENVFGNQYSETGKGPKELSSVQLIVNDVTGDKSTKEFTLTVSFGELLGKDSKTFNIDTREGRSKGSGTLDIQYAGEKAVVTVKGTSAEGPGIDLKMECHKVMTMKNLGQ